MSSAAGSDEHWRKAATVRSELLSDNGPLAELDRKIARRYLHELLPGTSRVGKKLLLRFGRYIYTRGYAPVIDVDAQQREHIREIAEKHPITYVCNHRSQVDSFAIFCALHDNELPHPITFGGINMKIPVMGNILKGGGLVFIRRAFQDNRAYKSVLRAYIDYLVEHGLPLFWAIEGTRSRTGKLVPPRFGLMNWVLDAHERMSDRDMMIVPVSVSYDQIADVNSYSEEERGATKKPEDFKWLVEYVRGFGQPLGKISVSFGEPVSVRQEVAENGSERKRAVSRIVVKACSNMNDVTPLTPPSLIATALLGATPHALTAGELRSRFVDLASYAAARNWPASFDLEGDVEKSLGESVDSLVQNDVLVRHDGGHEQVISIARDRELNASYYRNNSIHFFVPGAIGELAMIAAAGRDGDPVESLEHYAWRLRDLLRYEFYFRPRDEFLSQVREDLERRCPDWHQAVAAGPEQAWEGIATMRPLLSHKVLPCFLEAYQVVLSELEAWPADEEFDRKQFIAGCIKSGEQLYRLGRISNRESVARAMFETGLLAIRGQNSPTLADDLEKLLAMLTQIRALAAARSL